MKKVNITKEDFLKYIGQIVSQDDYDDGIIAAFNANGYCGEFMYPSLVDTSLSLLELLTNDEDDWINYWFFDLYHGKRYEDGMVKDKDGNIIKLETAEDLWNILVQ